MNEILVDAAAWVGLADEADPHHQKATDAFPNLLRNYNHFVTTNLILGESYNLIHRRCGHQAAISFIKSIYNSQKIKVVYINQEDDQKAIQILEKYDDQAFSLVDATSFVVMQQREIQEVFTFDHHFWIMGYSVVP